MSDYINHMRDRIERARARAIKREHDRFKIINGHAKIELPNWQWGFIEQMSNAKADRFNGSTSRKQKKGIAGEFATQLYFKESPPQIQMGKDYGVDLVVAGGTCDVKATNYGNSYLVFPYDGAFKADLAVLALVDWGKAVHLAGWITKKEWCARAQSLDFGIGRGPARVVEVQQLNKIQKLKEFDERFNH